jgi:hypothetical protein
MTIIGKNELNRIFNQQKMNSVQIYTVYVETVLQMSQVEFKGEFACKPRGTAQIESTQIRQLIG